MLGRGKLGAGRDARFHEFERSGTLQGVRFVLRRTAADALTRAMTSLVAEGFTAREDDLDARLQGMGSPWLAQAAEIGDTRGSWTKGFLTDLIEDTPLIFLNRFQRGIAPTLAMVTARELPDATSELVVFPHPGSTGDPSGAMGAAARLRAAYQTIEAAGTVDGSLVSHERLRGIRNDGSPASQQMVRELLGWT